MKSVQVAENISMLSNVEKIVSKQSWTLHL